MLHVKAHCPETMVVFPGAKEFMQVARGKFGGVFFQQHEQMEACIQHCLGCLVVCCDTTAVFVGSLDQAHHEVSGRYVVRVDGRIG